jgi:hypothetical protein
MKRPRSYRGLVALQLQASEKRFARRLRVCCDTPAVDTREAAERWRDVWARGWRAQETHEILALYAPGATLQSHPFRDVQAPRDYIDPTFGEEVSAECEFREPIVDGDRAAVEWSADTKLKDGGTEKLAGVSLLRFDADGLVVEQRDFWAMG